MERGVIERACHLHLGRPIYSYVFRSCDMIRRRDDSSLSSAFQTTILNFWELKLFEHLLR